MRNLKNLPVFICITITLLFSRGSIISQTFVPDDNFEAALISLGYDSGPLDDYVSTNVINQIKVLSLASKNISDLTGIEDFISLQELNCSNNHIMTLELNQNPCLKKLRLTNNEIVQLDISNNIELIDLFIGHNYIESVNLSIHSYLKNLSMEGLSLTNLDLSNNVDLEYLNCQNNSLTSLHLGNHDDLLWIYAAGNELTSVDVSSCSSLKTLSVAQNTLEEIDIRNNPKLEALFVGHNEINELNLSYNRELIYLNTRNNPITELSLFSNPLLRVLDCSNNELSSFPKGLGTLAHIRRVILHNNNIGGCWPPSLINLCSMFSPNYNFKGNISNGASDFISNEGYEQFCNGGAMPCEPCNMEDNKPIIGVKDIWGPLTVQEPLFDNVIEISAGGFNDGSANPCGDEADLIFLARQLDSLSHEASVTPQLSLSEGEYMLDFMVFVLNHCCDNQTVLVDSATSVLDIRVVDTYD